MAPRIPISLSQRRHYPAPARQDDVEQTENVDNLEDGGERKWSTPLAKQLADAIEVCVSYTLIQTLSHQVTH
jgi:hypothetical protein